MFLLKASRTFSEQVSMQLTVVKNLSSPQRDIFNSLMSQSEAMESKQVNLVAYMVQRLKPIIQPYQVLVLQQIQNQNINQNQDVDVVMKLIKQYLDKGFNHQQVEESLMVNCKRELEQNRIKQVISRYKNQSKEEIMEKLNQMNLSTDLVKSYTSSRPIPQKISQFSARDLEICHNTPEQIRNHLKVTQGKVMLRFPPEPNGFLHLGHVRSIRLNFHSAQTLNGHCYLRFDDTNPEAEKQEYIEAIYENVQWFGYEPFKITYASDHFQYLFDSAVKLIKNQQAYVCEQTKEEMAHSRMNKYPSPYQQRSVQENLDLFYQMQGGLIPENQCTLRLKIDYAHNNPTLRDPVIYRVKNTPHPRTKNQWKVYPTYDFTHCICDSLENITHSLCTLEFEIRRELYYWILNALNLYKPFVYEFSRLNVSGNLLSKRKIQKLVEGGFVQGWNDPRLLTLSGLRKRGYTSTALNTFIDMCGLPRAGNEHIISMQVLEHCIRKELEPVSEKLMSVLDPIRVIIDNQLQVWIEKKDISLEQNDNFYGIKLNSLVCLKHFGVIKCTFIGESVVHATLVSTDIADRKACRGQLHWIKDGQQAIVNEYSDLFNGDLDEDYLAHYNPESHQIKHAIVPVKKYKVGERFQFERLGYYIVDQTEDSLVFNKIVALKK